MKRNAPGGRLKRLLWHGFPSAVLVGPADRPATAPGRRAAELRPTREARAALERLARE